MKERENILERKFFVWYEKASQPEKHEKPGKWQCSIPGIRVMSLNSKWLPSGSWGNKSKQNSRIFS